MRFHLILAVCGLAGTGLSPAGGLVLNPVADTYVRNSNPTTAITQNFGTAVNFVANNANGVRVSFLQFDLSSVSGPITNAQLKLMLNLASAGQTFNVYGLTNGEGWSETGLTWSTAPAVIANYDGTTGTLAQYLKPADLFSNGLALSTFTSGAAVGAEDVAFDSTPAALNFINADTDRVVTFVIAEPDPADTGGVAWNSREATTGQPTLIINEPGTNSLPAPDFAPRLLHVYLQGGQSNSDGRAKTNGLPVRLLQPQSDVPLFYYLTGGAANADGSLGRLITLQPGISALGGGTTFGPELSFGRALADYFARSNNVPASNAMVVLVKFAHGGTTLAADWMANGNATTNGDGVDYVTFQKVVAAGLSNLAGAYPNAVIELDGMIWVQGESDIDLGNAAVSSYGVNLTRFINDVRQTFAAHPPYGTNLPFFFSRISANQTVYSSSSDPDYQNYLLLRAGQAAVAAAVTNVFMIDTDDAQFSALTPWSSPGLHFDTAGQRALGTAFGQAVIRALPPPSLTLPMKSGNSLHLAFTGVPGTTHSVLRAPAVSGPWTLLTNIVLGPWGGSNYDDAVLPGSHAFYRISRP